MLLNGKVEVDGGRCVEATYLPPRAAPLKFATETLYRKYYNQTFEFKGDLSEMNSIHVFQLNTFHWYPIKDP